jgi:hypothetical protein
MASYKLNIFFIIGTVFIISSCSKNTLTGFYNHDKKIAYEELAEGPQEDSYLELKKDSTFIYENFFSQYNGGDVADGHYSFLGNGRYQVKNKEIVLYFDENFKVNKADTLDIDPRFKKNGYKIEDQPIIGKQILPINIHRDSTKLGDLIKIK